MVRAEVTTHVLEAKRRKNLTWKQIASAIGGASPVFITAALLGQMRLDDAQAEKAVEVLGLPREAASLLKEIPYRGSLPPGPPTDPVLYRFYELLQVYGTTLKELIQEEFGDGIMSAIDFELSVQRKADPKGDRVSISMSGKFLPYRRY